jgi:hypothetical protein
VKLERLGSIITGYVSPDGTNWAATDVGRFDAPVPTTLYVGLVVCSTTNGTLNTSTFSNVQITGGNGGAPIVTPAAPAALVASPGEGVVPLRWQSSFGATSYTVKRATTSGGPYSTIASGITTSSYTDTTVTNGTTYYYVVTASNSTGTSGNSPEDSAKPLSPLVNVAVNGTPTASANGSSSTEGAAQAFDGTTNTKWFNANAGTTGWIQCDFGAGNAQTIKRYTVASANDVPGRDPKNWQLQGSNDDSAWTTLDTQSNQTFANRWQTNTYTVASLAAYRYYRLNITANNGDTAGLQLSEFALLDDAGRTLPDGTYNVFSRYSNKPMAASNGGTANGTPLVQWGYTGGNEQKWTFTYLGNGQYKVVGFASGRVMAVSGASTSNGTNLILWDWLGGNEQKWTIYPIGNGLFRMTAVHDGKVADVEGPSTADGAHVHQWSYVGVLNQKWFFTLAP